VAALALVVVPAVVPVVVPVRVPPVIRREGTYHTLLPVPSPALLFAFCYFYDAALRKGGCCGTVDVRAGSNVVCERTECSSTNGCVSTTFADTAAAPTFPFLPLTSERNREVGDAGGRNGERPRQREVRRRGRER
jgi:hypothetical protein